MGLGRSSIQRVGSKKGNPGAPEALEAPEEQALAGIEQDSEETIELGQSVHLKPTDLKDLGLNRQLQGGEGKVVWISEDAKGTIYTIQLNRNGRTRVARRESLVIHRKGPSKKEATRPSRK